MVAMFPANVAVNLAKDWQLIPSNVKVSAVSGSVWQGKVNLLSYRGIDLDHVRWELSAVSILMGNADLKLTIGRRGSDIKAKGHVVLSSDSVSVNDFTLSTPIEPFTQFYPLPYGLTTSGKVNVNINQFTQGQPWCESLDGEVIASEVLVQSAFGKLDVDKLTATLACPQGKLLATLQPKTNSLGIDGSAQLDKARQYLVDANISPPSNASPDYLNVLKFSGTPNSKGQYVFQYKGAL